MSVPSVQSRSPIANPYLLSMLALLLASLLVSAAQVYGQLREKDERGRIAIQSLQKYHNELSQISFAETKLREYKVWPDKFSLAERWMVLQTVQNANPRQIADRLRELRVTQPMTPAMRISLERWANALFRWEDSQSQPKSVAADSLLAQGRQIYFEAAGYQKIGRAYDATALYLWSVELLTSFIQRNPRNAEVSEALYLIGDSYLRLAPALPEEFQGDRILSVCSQLYPNTVWAQQAESLRRREMVPEAPGNE